MMDTRDGAVAPSGDAGNFALVATVKDEGPYLWEWVAYHRMIGFQTIIVFQNDSTDGTHHILAEMARHNLITYKYNKAPRGCHQIRAYARASRQAGYQAADFVMALDLDEFLVIHAGDGTLPSLFKAMPEFDCAYINWRKFGNAGFVAPQDGLLTERFTRCENGADMAKRVEPFKTLFRRSAFARPGVHLPLGFGLEGPEPRIVNGSGLTPDQFALRNFQCSDPGLQQFAQINHYIVRDASSFILKSAKGSAHQANRSIDYRYWRKRNRNGFEDLRLAALAPRIRAAMQQMDRLCEGRLAVLTEQARAHHRREIDAVLAGDWGRRLYDLCVADPSSARVMPPKAATLAAVNPLGNRPKAPPPVERLEPEATAFRFAAAG